MVGNAYGGRGGGHNGIYSPLHLVTDEASLYHI